MKTVLTNFLWGGGKTGILIRQKDWSVTSLGSTDTWPPGLLMALTHVLNSKLPSLLFWGNDYNLFYNDSYSPCLEDDDNYPAVLGQPARYVWPKQWPRLKALLDGVRSTGEGTTGTDLLLPVFGHQQPRNVQWMFSYSPVCDETGAPAGVVVTCTETTQTEPSVLEQEYSDRSVQVIDQKYKLVLDSLPANIAILDTKGTIRSINKPWLRFSLENSRVPTGYLGTNYLEVCRESGEMEGLRLATGIEDVIADKIQDFRVDYPCPTPSEERWLRAYVTPLYRHGRVTEVVVTYLDVTKRKKAERVVQRALRQKQKILDASLDVICAFDAEGRFIQVSQACRDVWGYERKELLGTPYMNLVWEEDKASTVAAAARIMGGESMRNFENRYIRKDGSLVPIVWSARWDFEENAMFCVARDATEQKQAEEQLVAYSQKLISTLESITDGFLVLDREWQVTYWNNKAEHLLKKPREAVLGQNLWHIYQEAIPLKFYSEYKRAVAEQKSVHFEEYLPSLRMWFDVSAYPSDEGLSVYFKDITIRKQAEEQIRIAKERYDIVTRATHDAIWDWDLCTDVLYWGEGYRILFGYEVLEETAFGGGRDRIHPEDVHAVTQSIDRAILSPDEEQWKAVYRFLKADGTYATVLDRGFILRNQEGTPIRMIGAMQDITLQKQREEEREQLISELIKTNHDLRQFSYITTHNFRAPLSNLIGLLNLMKGFTIEDPLLAEIIQGFRTSTVALNDTINDLISILIIKETPSITKEYVKLREVYNKVYSQIRIPIEEAGADIHFDDQAAAAVWFERTYMESIFMNLLTNSLKFRASSRELKITISSYKVDNRVQLVFRDNGIGLDLNRYGSRIFGLNQRFHNRSDSKGIGLYLIKSQIESMGGTIEVESEVNVGTTFTITF